MYQWYKNPYILLIMSGILTAAVLPFWHTAHFGYALFFFFFSTILYVHKPQERRLSSLAILLSILLFIRSEESVLLLTLATLVYIISFVMSPVPLNGLITTLFRPFTLFLSFVRLDKKWGIYTDHFLKGKKKMVDGSHLVFSLIVSVAVLFLIVPLLASVNPLFSNVVQSFFEFFRFDWLVRLFEEIPFLFWVVRGILFLLLLTVLPNIFRLMEGGSKPIERSATPKDLLIPQMVTAVVLIIFLMTQMKLYLASTESLLALGYSHSSLTREVFGQLSAVALVIFALLYFGKRTTGIFRFVTPLLFIETVFLMAIALKSDLDYITAWGFTYKRLYGLVFVLWLGGAYWFLYRYLMIVTESGERFIRRLAWLTVGAVVVVNVANFDYLIARHGQSVTHEGVDYEYMAGLSADSLSYHLLVPEVLEKADRVLSESEDVSEIVDLRYTVQRLRYRIVALESKYTKDIDIRSVSLLEYFQYTYLMGTELDESAELQKVADALRLHESVLFPAYPSEDDLEIIEISPLRINNF